MTTGMSSLIPVILDFVMPVVLNMPNSLQPRLLLFCLDCPHRHIVFTIPEELRNWFRQDRSRLNLLFVASRNTISILTNKSLADKLKKKKLSDTHYIFKDIPIRNEFGMIATIHTFTRP